MKKLLILGTLTPLIFASQITVEKAVKDQFNSVIAPQIIKNLKNNSSYTITLHYDLSKGTQLKITVTKPVKKGEYLIILHKKGDYNIGYKYYTKYIFKTSKIKVTDFLKMLNIKTAEDLDRYFKNNAELLINSLNELDQKYAVEGLKKIIKKGKLDDLKAFLKGVLAGKVPASCS